MRTGAMELTGAHSKRIRESLPVERGNVSMEVVGEKVLGQTPKETEYPYLALNNRLVSILSLV